MLQRTPDNDDALLASDDELEEAGLIEPFVRKDVYTPGKVKYARAPVGPPYPPRKANRKPLPPTAPTNI